MWNAENLLSLILESDSGKSTVAGNSGFDSLEAVGAAAESERTEFQIQGGDAFRPPLG